LAALIPLVQHVCENLNTNKVRSTSSENTSLAQSPQFLASEAIAVAVILLANLEQGIGRQAPRILAHQASRSAREDSRSSPSRSILGAANGRVLSDGAPIWPRR